MTLVPNSRLVVRVEPALGGQPVVQRRLGDRREHADHREGDPRLLDELAIWASKIGLVVVVETHDHAAPDLHAGVLDAVDLLEQRAARADVLELLGLAERLLVGALDADEDGDEVGLDHQLHQLGVVGQVDRRLGEEGQRVAVLAPARRSTSRRTGLDRLLVADQVVVDDEDDRASLGARIASSSAMTCADGLDPRAAAEGDDDVAELALERAAARELEAAEGVVPHLEQVEPRRRAPCVMSVFSACS